MDAWMVYDDYTNVYFATQAEAISYAETCIKAMQGCPGEEWNPSVMEIVIAHVWGRAAYFPSPHDPGTYEVRVFPLPLIVGEDFCPSALGA